ncbi:hypothetical protein [Halomonas sp. MMSF_3323]|uniref:hypothetical protein n=1 Tax=Halomonas sp. MMSF_3323 TaxID=3046701 RepID=UPI00273E9330|nr:hypothetical protein [Halomonas sp. MMSF_3323]
MHIKILYALVATLFLVIGHGAYSDHKDNILQHDWTDGDEVFQSQQLEEIFDRLTVLEHE